MSDTVFGPSTCRHCGKSYTLPGEHKCSPTYTELQAELEKAKTLVKRLCDGIETVNNACVEKTRALQAEVKRLEGELAA